MMHCHPDDQCCQLHRIFWRLLWAAVAYGVWKLIVRPLYNEWPASYKPGDSE
jgi:hypothetical protein